MRYLNLKHNSKSTIVFMGVFVLLNYAFSIHGPRLNRNTTQQTNSGQQQNSSTNSQEPQFAHLKVYRQRRYMGSALAPSICIDGREVARVGNGRRVGIKLLPGTHNITSDDKSSIITLDAKVGQEYFIRVDEAVGFWKGHGKLILLMPEQGSPEYKMQKPIEPDRQIVKDVLEDLDEIPSNAEPSPKRDKDTSKKQ